MQSFGELGPIDARRAMAIDAAMFGERLGAGLHGGGIVMLMEAGGWSSAWRLIDAVRTRVSAQVTTAGSSAVPATL